MRLGAVRVAELEHLVEDEDEDPANDEGDERRCGRIGQPAEEAAERARRPLDRFFQPHGYGPLRQMGDELAEVFASHLDPGDALYVCDPVYFGGTVDRSRGSQELVDAVKAAGGPAEMIPERKNVGDRLVAVARPGDRIVIMGARDDTLSTFARDIFSRLT